MIRKISLLLAALSPLLLSACSSFGLAALNATSRIESGHPVAENIAYGQEVWQRLDVHMPGKLDTDSPPVADNGKPVVVFFYGGGWTSGERDQYYFAASAFTDLGYVVVVPDYVKYPKGKFPTFVEDGAAATAWTKKNIVQHGGDPNKIFLVGHSAGAHLGALLMADPSYLQAQGVEPTEILGFAGMAGPYNFTPKRKPYTKIFGPEENFPKMKVMNYIDGNQPPMILLHGTDDDTVGILNKDSLVEKIKQNGGVFADVSYPGVSHVGILLSLHPTFVGEANAATDIHEFFAQRLSEQLSANAP